MTLIRTVGLRIWAGTLFVLFCLHNMLRFVDVVCTMLYQILLTFFCVPVGLVLPNAMRWAHRTVDSSQRKLEERWPEYYEDYED